MKEMFKEIFEHSNIVLFDTSTYIPATLTTYRRNETINMANIGTALIQTAGRWCERYASDLFIEWDSLQESLKEHVENKDAVETEIYVFGFRYNGVDHDAYVMSHMKDPNCHISEYYSKIYAVKIQDIIHDSGSKTIQITMKDILNDVICYTVNN